jgi:valyl-tRNA synthetase
MKARYEDWVNGLNGDWCISRQRFFGVPFPVWYPLDDAGRTVHETPIFAAADQLPMDPSTEVPKGYRAEQRGQPGGFVGDPDIMDTWATSSLTPQIVCGWADDPELFARTFPMQLRPQAHDIIRTWLFTTVLRSHLEEDKAPWAHAAISGWVLDPDRKKMSKSKGNVVTPLALLEEHGSDGVRYWAASGRPGTDTTFDPGQMKVGRRLAIKVLNASRFALGAASPQGPIAAPVDRAMIRSLSHLVEEATAAFEAYDYARALQRTESFFWKFCDDYLELVKGRRYGEQDAEGAGSANAALTAALSVLLRLLAPFLPFVTEEVWSWWQEGSIHTAAWPVVSELDSLLGESRDVTSVTGTGDVTIAAPVIGGTGGVTGPTSAATGESDRAIYEWATEVLFEVRKQRSEAKQPLKVFITRVTVKVDSEKAQLMPLVDADLRSALRVRAFETTLGEPREIVVAGYEPAAPVAQS